ncbi:MAG: 5'-3' exonuclease H3TH domain-containing protein [Candidatus Ornithospirochaeta sp.]
MERLLIIDGNNLLFQMFYGMPAPIYNKSGRPIHGTIGFISFVIKEIKLLYATKAIVVFDGDGAEERIKEYPEYKANRENDWEGLEPEEIPFSQEEDIKKALDYMEIKYIYSEGTEADDYIASIAKKGEEKGDVVISSFDSDFFQLISERVSVLRYRGKASVLWDKTRFISEFGFSPEFYSLYKAITGDTSDNIKGIEGMGRKRTSLFIKSYEKTGSIENISLSLALKKRIVENIELIKRNKKLIDFKKVEVGIEYENLNFSKKKVEEGNSKVLENSGVFK